MKKFKLLPSLIILVLCVGALAVGVYALSPISNSVAGTISISAGKASLAITGYVDDAIVYPRTELHEGMDWTIDSSKLNFNVSSYLFAEQVPSKEIKLVIENLSSKPYGVFFCDTAGENATSSNIKTTGEVKSGTTTIVNASMDNYKYISVADSTSTLDQVEMTITLSVANISASAQSGSFKYYLNVEEYNSSLNTTEEFIKINDSLTLIEASAYANNTTVKNVIIPSTITSIGAGAFSGCTGLTEIMIPASVTNIGAGAFNGCNSLQKIIVDAHSEAGDFGGSANLPSVDGKSWFVGDNLAEFSGSTQLIKYHTTKQVYELRDGVDLVIITVSYNSVGLVYIDEDSVVLQGAGAYIEGCNVMLGFSAVAGVEGNTLDLYAYNTSTSNWEWLCSWTITGNMNITYEITASSEYTQYEFKCSREPGPFPI